MKLQMFSQGHLGRADNIVYYFQLGQIAVLKLVLNFGGGVAFVFTLFLEENAVCADIEGNGNGGKHRKAHLCVAGFDMAHVRG